MKSTDEWAAVLARMERWAESAWQPPAQGRDPSCEIRTWRVTAPVALQSGDDHHLTIHLDPGNLLGVERWTSHDDYWNGPVSWATAHLRVLDGPSTGALVEHTTVLRGGDEPLEVHHPFPPPGLEPADPPGDRPEVEP